MSRFDVADVLVALCEAGEVDLAARIARAMGMRPEEPCGGAQPTPTVPDDDKK
jgi:hypothetical protein